MKPTNLNDFVAREGREGSRGIGFRKSLKSGLMLLSNIAFLGALAGRSLLGVAILSALLLSFGLSSLKAHHFKGLPHYNYFENYPQVPEEEFLGQAGSYEFSLVVYDFQGINRDNMQAPDTVRMFLVVFNLQSSDVYVGPATLEVLDGRDTIYTERQKSAELENLYSIHQDLSDTGNFSLRVTLHGRDDLQCVIPFTLSHQKIHWGPWVIGGLFVIIVIAAIGARKARIAKDRIEAKQRERESVRSLV